MQKVKFTEEESNILVAKLQTYFSDTLNRELGQFEASFLLDFIGEQFGSYYYNRGLYDAQNIFQKRIDLIAESIYDIEMPTEFDKPGS